MPALDNEQRGQRVAAAFERRKAKSNGSSNDHAITSRKGAETQSDQDDCHAFHEFLDEPNLKHADKTRTVDQPEFEHRRDQHPEQSADDEGGRDASWRERGARIVVEVPDNGGDRHQEAAEQHDAREEEQVARQERDTYRCDPEGESDEQDNPPPGRPALSVEFLRTSSVRY